MDQSFRRIGVLNTSSRSSAGRGILSQAEVATLQRQDNEKKRLIERLRMELEDVKARNKELTKAQKSTSSSSSEITQLKRDNISLQNENSALLGKLDRLEEKNSSLQSTLSTLQRSKNELSDILLSLTEDKSSHEGGPKTAGLSRQRQKQEIRRMLQNVQSTEAEDYRRQSSELQRAIAEEKTRVRSLQDEKLKLQSTIQTLRHQNDRFAKSNEDLSKQLQIAKQQVLMQPVTTTIPSKQAQLSSFDENNEEETSSRIQELSEKLEKAKGEAKRLRIKLQQSVEVATTAQEEASHLREISDDFLHLLSLARPEAIASQLHELKQKHSNKAFLSLDTSNTELSTLLRSAPFIDWADVNVGVAQLEAVHADIEKERNLLLAMLLEAARTSPSPSHTERAEILQRLDRLQRRTTPNAILDTLDELLKIERRLARTKQRQDEINTRGEKQKKKKNSFRPYRYDASNAATIFNERMYDLEELAAVVAEKRRQDTFTSKRQQYSTPQNAFV